MGGTMQVNERAEVGVDGDQDAVFRGRPPEHGGIAGGGASLARFGDVMSLSFEPFRQTAPGASIDQESHAGTIRTASSRSWAITAWA